jgi:hypothetical protein
MTYLEDTDNDTIMQEVLSGVPLEWRTVLTPHLLNLGEFTDALKYFEKILCQYKPLASLANDESGLENSDSSSSSDDRAKKRSVKIKTTKHYSVPKRSNTIRKFRALPKKSPRALLGQVSKPKNFKYPKDDSTVSKGTTPDEKGARPCRHCGSGNHWDYECKYTKREARANLALIETTDNVSGYESRHLGYYETSDAEDSEVDDSEVEESLSQESGSEEDSSGVYSFHAMTLKDKPSLRGSMQTPPEEQDS